MADVIMTINEDKTASINRSYLAVQGEKITVQVNIPSSLAALGYDAYIDFLQPDGLAYFRGPYDCSLETFEFSLGAYDSILDKNGEVLWQFVLAETSGDNRDVMWAAITYKTQVLYSVGATSSAILPYVPQMIFPNDYPAANITIADAGDRITAVNAEDALQEIALNVQNLTFDKVGFTATGGIAVKLINKTGSASVKGEVVRSNSGLDNSVIKIVKDVPDPIGVFYEAGVVDGDEAWVVIAGIAEVYFVASTTRGHLARGFLTSDGASYVTGQALSEAVPTSPFASDKHFYEIGHVLETRSGAGLAKCILHFN